MKKINYNPKNLKLNDVIRLFDPCVYAVIWTQDNEDEPDWTGYLLDLPWHYLDGIVGSENENDDEPISFRENLGKDCNNKPGLVISLITR